MTIDHLKHRMDAWFQTEFSSWASSFGVAFHYFGSQKQHRGADDSTIYLSIIDTQALWDRNAIFYAPHLAFLNPETRNYNHEYLAHGVIYGPAHKAMPLKVFKDAGVHCRLACTPNIRLPILTDDDDPPISITPVSMERGRAIGDKYGGMFALPMCLAVVCRIKRDADLFRKGVENLDVILRGIRDLAIPQYWSLDRVLRLDAHFVRGYGDVEQMYRRT